MYLQLKSTDNLPTRKGGGVIPWRILRSDLANWLYSIAPFILIVYDAKDDQAYWLYVQRHFQRMPGFNLFSVGKSVTAHIPKTNAFDGYRGWLITMREIHYTEHFNYGELRRTLSALAFEEHTGLNEFNAPFRAFYHRKTKSLFAVLDKPDDAPLEPLYLRIAEKGVEDWGIADSVTFFKLLREAAQNEQKQTQAA